MPRGRVSGGMEPISLEAVRERHDAGDEPFYEFLREGELSVGRYVLPAGGDDPQEPHTEDEIYYVLEGVADVEIDGEVHPVEPGDVVYVGRGVDHRFLHIERRLELLVVFAPPEGTLAG